MLKKIIMIIVISILLSILLITLLFSIFSEKKDTINQKQITETQTIKPKEENPTPTRKEAEVKLPEIKIEKKFEYLNGNQGNLNVEITRTPKEDFDEINKILFLEFDIVNINEPAYMDEVVDTTNLYPIDLSKGVNLTSTVDLNENSRYINESSKKILADKNINMMVFSTKIRDRNGKLLHTVNTIMSKQKDKK